MDVTALTTDAAEAEADLLGVLVAEPPELGAAARELDEALGGALSRLAADGDVTGKRGSVALLHRAEDTGPRRIAVAGLGPADRATAEDARIAAAGAVAKLGEKAGRTVAWLLDPAGTAISPDELARALVDGLALGPHSAARWRSSDPPADPVEHLVLVGPDAEAALEEARRATVVARWANRCRDLVNAPASELTPTDLAAAAAEIAGNAPTLDATVLGPAELE